MFRFKKGIRASYIRQGYIYFVSQSYKLLKPEQQRKLDELILSCGGENRDALFEYVTSEHSPTSICLKYFIASKSTLYKAVKKYYERFPKRL